MKLYDFAGAPNPKKVRMYLNEKGIEDIEIVTFSSHREENMKFRRTILSDPPQSF